MLHDPKTVNESDFDQETEEKIAPQFIAQLELANITCQLLFSCSLWLTSQLAIRVVSRRKTLDGAVPNTNQLRNDVKTNSQKKIVSNFYE